MVTVNLTLEQIRLIFKAGMKRGSDEATAYDWGCSANGSPDDELSDALHDIANEGLKYGDDRYVTFGKPEVMLADFAEAQRKFRSGWKTPSIEERPF